MVVSSALVLKEKHLRAFTIMQDYYSYLLKQHYHCLKSVIQMEDSRKVFWEVMVEPLMDFWLWWLLTLQFLCITTCCMHDRCKLMSFTLICQEFLCTFSVCGNSEIQNPDNFCNLLFEIEIQSHVIFLDLLETWTGHKNERNQDRSHITT